jgi:hypothetical protein
MSVFEYTFTDTFGGATFPHRRETAPQSPRHRADRKTGTGLQALTRELIDVLDVAHVPICGRTALPKVM